MSFDETQEFVKDFKHLSKKYKSLSADLLEFKKIVTRFPIGTGKHFATLTEIKDIKIIKARFFCRYLKGSSLRVIYSYSEKDLKIDFIELYFKGDKASENQDRIREYLQQ